MALPPPLKNTFPSRLIKSPKLTFNNRVPSRLRTNILPALPEKGPEMIQSLKTRVTQLPKDSQLEFFEHVIEYQRNSELLNYYTQRLDRMKPIELVETDMNGLYAKAKQRAEKQLQAIKEFGPFTEDDVKVLNTEYLSKHPGRIEPVLKNIAQLKVHDMETEARLAVMEHMIEYERHSKLMKLYSDKLDSLSPVELVETDLARLYANANAQAQKHLNFIERLAAVDKNGIKRLSGPKIG